MPASQPSKSLLARLMPITDWLRRYQRRDLRGDLFAGLTAGAMLVPQGMVYAQLAGLPPQIGLYAATVPLLVYAIFGTSRQLSVGPVAVISLLTATALAPLADGDPVAYAAAAATLALIVGAVSLLLGVARMGWVTNLLSHSVLVGFTAASAVIIAVGQLKQFLGVKFPRVDSLAGNIGELVKAAGEIDPLTTAIGAISLLALVILKRWRRSFPGALVVAGVATAASAIFRLGERGVGVVGDVPSGLAPFALPSIESGTLADLAGAGVLIAVIGYVESVAVAKVYARKNRYEIDPNQELVALGAANIAAAVFSGQPVTGGFSRTAVNADAGARTMLASIVTAGFIGLVLLFFTSWFRELPQAVLAAVVIAAVYGLIDVAEMRHIATINRFDGATLAIAAIGTLVFGVELGIAVAVVASLAIVFVQVMNPHSAELGRVPGTETFRNIARFSDCQTTPGIGILRIDVTLNFANVAFFKRRLHDLDEAHGEGLQHIVLDCSAINGLDASAEAALQDVVTEFADQGTQVHLADIKGPVRDVLIRSGLWTKFGEHIHPTVHLALEAIGGRPTDRLKGLHECGTHNPFGPANS